MERTAIEFMIAARAVLVANALIEQLNKPVKVRND